MPRDRFVAALLACALALAPVTGWSQDASPTASADATAATADATGGLVGPVDPNDPLPPNHPSIGGSENPHGNDPMLRRAALPETFAEETPGIPPGTMLVRVLDGQGNPVPEALIHVGSLRDGERGDARDVRAGPDGIARVEGLDTGGGIAYRVSTEHEGARFGAPPFQLSDVAGHRVQIARTDVDHSGRAVLIWEARVEIRFKDDRLVVVERLKIVNLSGMSISGDEPRPVTYVPTNGLRFELPEGWTAFTPAPSMSDMHLTTEGDAVVFRGSVPPTARDPMDVVFQYHVKLRGGEVDLRTTLPLPVVSTTVITEAPRGLTLAVDGMPTAESREGDGQRVLLTGVERRPNDPPLREVKIHLGGIPASAGPARVVAATVAALLVLGALYYAFSVSGGARVRRTRAVVEAERDRVLAEMEELVRLHRAEEIGPVTYKQRRKELALWLASVLKELDEAVA